VSEGRFVNGGRLQERVVPSVGFRVILGTKPFITWGELLRNCYGLFQLLVDFVTIVRYSRHVETFSILVLFICSGISIERPG
jgi:hypothetical protein